MLKWTIIFFFILSFFAGFSQQNGLVLGRSLVLPQTNQPVRITFSHSLPPDSLEKYHFILVFSSAHSNLSEQHIELLQEYVWNGGGLYIGADNWPFFAESNQLTQAFFGKSYWGNQNGEMAEVNTATCSNRIFKDQSEVPSGESTVSFPMDYRLKVEAWNGDEPLILSGSFGKGKIILDGGYSRFNTELFSSSETGQMLEKILLFIADPNLK